MAGALREAFDRSGYAVARGVFDPAQLTDLEAAFDRVVLQLRASEEDVNARWSSARTDELDGGDSEIVHTHNVQQYSAAWLRALLHEPFLDAAEQIIGNDVVLHHTKLFLKPPETGSPFPLHQDWSYFPTERGTMIAAVIHVSAANEEMGGIRVVPGSHRLGPIANSDGHAPCPELEALTADDTVTIDAAPGDVLFFHAHTVHGSGVNRSDTPRKTVLVQLHAGDDAVQADNAHPNEALVLRGWNERMTRSRTNR